MTWYRRAGKKENSLYTTNQNEKQKHMATEKKVKEGSRRKRKGITWYGKTQKKENDLYTTK